VDYLQAILLGIVQGLTEFLPISSSAHLLLLPYLFGWPHLGLAFDVALHTGTTLAIVAYFGRELWHIGRALLRFRDPAPAQVTLRRTGWAILVSCVPAGILGLLFQDQIETIFRAPVFAGLNLILFGILLYAADHRLAGSRTLSEIKLPDALAIGALQALALVPGVSRSGITITAGLGRRLRRDEAARFSFLMISPLVVAASGLKFWDLYRELAGQGQLDAFLGHGLWVFLAGLGASFATGVLCIRCLLSYLRRFSFDGFVLYRILFGLLILGLAAANKL